MGVFRQTVTWSAAAWALTFFGLWRRVWAVGLLFGLWIILSVKYVLRAIARRSGPTDA